MISFWKKRKYSIIFIVCFFFLCLLYQFQNTIFYRPKITHYYRQTECLSIALNYYERSMNFFYPELHLLFSDNHTTGYSVGEFPILYYLTALLWKIAGVHEFIPRLVNILLVFLGLFYLFRLGKNLFDAWWGIIIPLLFFTSPILIYYGNSPMPDSPAFGLALIGIYFFYRFYETALYKHLYWFAAVFLFAGLIKITSLIPFFVAMIIFLAEATKILKLKTDAKIFHKPVLSAIIFSGVIALIACWYVYAIWFNSIHGWAYSDNHINPIWNFTAAENADTLEYFREITSYQLFSPYTFFTFLFITLLCLLSAKKVNKLLWVSFFLVLSGTIVYRFLWFPQWKYDEYYMHPILMCLVITVVTFLCLLKTNSPQILFSRTTKIISAVFLLYNIWYASNNIRMRFGIINDGLTTHKHERDEWDWFNWNYRAVWEALETIEPYNRSLGIKKEDLVICIPDQTPCASLYLMNQRGWTSYFADSLCFDERAIKEKINEGAKYLFVRDSSGINAESLKQFLQNKIGQYRNISIYDLRSFR